MDEPQTTRYVLAVLRPLAVIIWAILVARPELTEEEAARHARALQLAAKAHDFDPLTGVAIIHSESRFESDAVSPDGEDYGLGQIRARHIGACKLDADPVSNPSPACQSVKRSLLEPEINIETMAELIVQNRRFCKQKTGSASFQRWLASYQGRNYPSKRRWCKPGKGTWAVIRYRQKLLKDLARAKIPNLKSATN